MRSCTGMQVWPPPVVAAFIRPLPAFGPRFGYASLVPSFLAIVLTVLAGDMNWVSMDGDRFCNAQASPSGRKDSAQEAHWDGSYFSLLTRMSFGSLV